MAMNYGLLSGVNEGIQSALGAYRDESRYQEQRADKAKDRALDNAFRRLEAKRQGYDIDTGTGEFRETAESLAKKQRENQAFDAASDFSRGERERAKGLLKGTRYAGLINDNFTGQQVKSTLDDVNPFLNREATERAAMAKLSRESGSNKSQFDALPKENQEQITKIAGNTANAKTIANQLRSDLEVLNNPKLNEDMKLTHARSMIKTLNSQQGQDAVGADEAKRLAALLEFNAWPNFTNPGPVFGRAPISDFTAQVENSLGALDQKIKNNDDTTRQLYGRPAAAAGGVAPPPGPTPQQVEQYAAQYKIDPATAQAILMQRMGGGNAVTAGR